jgi:hypothetical protein
MKGATDMHISPNVQWYMPVVIPMWKQLWKNVVTAIRYFSKCICEHVILAITTSTYINGKLWRKTRQWLMTIWALITLKGEMGCRYLRDLGISSVKLGDWFTMLYHYYFNHTYMSYGLISTWCISKFRKQGKPTSWYLSSGRLHILLFWGSFFNVFYSYVYTMLGSFIPPCPHPLSFSLTLPSPLNPHTYRQKLFCPYL